MRILLVISVLFLFFSCKKKKEDPCSSYQCATCCYNPFHYSYGPDIARLKFRPATYWIYIDSVTLQTDSVYVSFAYNDPAFFVPIYQCNDYPAYFNKYQHSLNSRTDSVFLSTNNMTMQWPKYYFNANQPGRVLRPAIYNRYNTVWWATPGTTTYTTEAVYAPQDVYPQTLLWYDTIRKMDSVFIYDRYYKQIEATSVQKDDLEDSLNTVYYVNQDYGLLRKDVFNTDGTLKYKWLLKNKNIVR